MRGHSRRTEPGTGQQAHAVDQGARDAACSAATAASGSDQSGADQEPAEPTIVRELARLPLYGGLDDRGNELVDKFTQDFILNDPDRLRTSVFAYGYKGFGGKPDYNHEAISNRTGRQRRKAAARTEKSWDHREIAGQLRDEGAARPRSRLELDECLSATEALENSGEPFGRTDIAGLVTRRRRRALGRRHAEIPDALSVDACAYGHYARERVIEESGGYSDTAAHAALVVSERCRETYFDEQMTDPRLPTKPEPESAV